MKFQIISISVEDMARAVEFYSKFFEREPDKQDYRLTVFELENTKFSLWNAKADNVEVEFGENCVPAFKTEDIEAEHSRLEDLAPEVEDIDDSHGYKIFHFWDTEGNMIEVFQGEKF